MANEPSAELSDKNNNNGAASNLDDTKTLYARKGNEAMEETKDEGISSDSLRRTGKITDNGVDLHRTQRDKRAMGMEQKQLRNKHEKIENENEDNEEDANDGDTAEESADDNEENGHAHHMDSTKTAKDDDDEIQDGDVQNSNEFDDDLEDPKDEHIATVRVKKEPARQSSKSSSGNGSSKTAEAFSKVGGTDATDPTGIPVAAPAPPPPVLKGTLSYNVDMRRHIIRGMWNYENSNALSAQRFELVRTLTAHEDVKVLPKDGEFHGSFSLAYFHTTSKGKQKERSKVIAESGVKIKFTLVEDEDYNYKVDGQGTNQFGIFNIYGTAKKSADADDPTYNIELRKRYAPSQVSVTPLTGTVTTLDVKKSKTNKKRKHHLVGQHDRGFDEDDLHEKELGPLPPPSQSYPSQVVCLRGKMSRDQSEDLGATEIMQRISGIWAVGLDLVLADPDNLRGGCHRFEYEHKSTLPNKQWPVSGRYSGWFELKNEDGTITKISERDVVLKFRKNNAGYHNVEGRGFNAFGKYNITGILTADNVLTIFRHFQPRKPKSKDTSEMPVTAIPPPLMFPGRASKALVPAQPESQLKLDQILVVGEEPMKPTEQPEHGTYSAVSRGVLRVNEDGAHTCSGKWGITREQFNNGQTSNFTFRLEPHFAAQGAADMKKANGDRPEFKNGDLFDPTAVSLSAAPLGSSSFPIDSAMYKGSFQMKRGATKYTSVIDHQIILKFRKNTQGAYNVYGKGTNSIGLFNLMGTLILSGKSSGHVELYRMYPVVAKPDEVLVSGVQQGNSVGTGGKFSAINKPKLPTSSHRVDSSQTLPEVSIIDPTPVLSQPPGPIQVIPGPACSGLPGPSRPGLSRRESSRLVKLPLRLEDDDPQAQLCRLMVKCAEIIKFVSDKDASTGKFFNEPVDPVAHGIPTYYQIINEPMDLGTIQRKMDANEILTPEEFGRLVRLVFENAMTFNVEPTHVVHQAGRSLLILFNQKFRDVERAIEAVRKTHKMSELEIQRLSVSTCAKDKGGKVLVKKRKKEELKSPKQEMLEMSHAMALANSAAMTDLLAAAPTDNSLAGPVSRAEFNLMLQMIRRLQSQVVDTLIYVAHLSSDEIQETLALPAPAVALMHTIPPVIPMDVLMAPQAITTVSEKKRPAPKTKKEAKVEVVDVDEGKPLTWNEQEQLTTTINGLDSSKHRGVIQIIKESADLDDDLENIDLDIDQLDTATQRKLYNYVMKVSYYWSLLRIHSSDDISQ